jgi:hypothetical protein
MTTHPLYDAAIAADGAYSATIQALFGPKATRWTITGKQHSHPAVLRAYKAKVDADTAWLQVMREASEARTAAIRRGER